MISTYLEPRLLDLEDDLLLLSPAPALPLVVTGLQDLLALLLWLADGDRAWGGVKRLCLGAE